MTKCDFCTQSTPDGKCMKNGYFDSQAVRQFYCEKAIERMEKALKGAR